MSVISYDWILIWNIRFLEYEPSICIKVNGDVFFYEKKNKTIQYDIVNN